MAALSKVRIANLALSLAGTKSTIQSLTESTTEATYANLWYDVARTEALESFDWTFARKRLTLATHSQAAPSEWGYRYQYPADCIAIREIVNPLGITADAAEFDLALDSTDQSRSILTNVEDAEAWYTMDQETVSIFPSEFSVSLAYLLASRLAFPLTGKRTHVEFLIGMSVATGAKAAANRANEEVKPAPREASWIRDRA